MQSSIYVCDNFEVVESIQYRRVKTEKDMKLLLLVSYKIWYMR